MVNQEREREKETITPQEMKRAMEVFTEYQGFVYKYYKLNEEIRSLDKFVQTIVAKELKLKVKLTLV